MSPQRVGSKDTRSSKKMIVRDETANRRQKICATWNDIAPYIRPIFPRQIFCSPPPLVVLTRVYAATNSPRWQALTPGGRLYQIRIRSRWLCGSRTSLSCRAYRRAIFHWSNASTPALQNRALTKKLLTSGAVRCSKNTSKFSVTKRAYRGKYARPYVA